MQNNDCTQFTCISCIETRKEEKIVCTEWRCNHQLHHRICVIDRIDYLFYILFFCFDFYLFLLYSKCVCMRCACFVLLKSIFFLLSLCYCSCILFGCFLCVFLFWKFIIHHARVHSAYCRQCGVCVVHSLFKLRLTMNPIIRSKWAYVLNAFGENCNLKWFCWSQVNNSQYASIHFILHFSLGFFAATKWKIKKKRILSNIWILNFAAIISADNLCNLHLYDDQWSERNLIAIH